MFGFLRLRRKGLSGEQRALYNAHFCAACHGMAEFGGTLSSFLTNYDQTFLQLVVSALDPEGAVAPTRRPCVAVPFRRVAVQPVSATLRPRLAALNVALIEAKLRDDVDDDGSRRARVGLKLLSGRAERAHRQLAEAGFPLDVLTGLPARQQLAEAADTPSLVTLSTPTGQALAEIFAFAATLTAQPSHEAALRALGEALGRFIYIFDALDDLEEDARRQRFNAILAALGERWSRTAVRGFLTGQLRRVQQSLDALPLGDRKTITDSLMRDLQSRLDRQLPGEAASLRSLRQRPAASGWLHALRRRAQGQRGDCDCGGCDGCCSGCDGCCSGCDSCQGAEACCDCSSCACDGANCCATGSCTFAQLLIVLAIILVIVVIIWFASRHDGSTTPPAPAPSATFTRTVPPAFPSPAASASPASRR